MKIGSLINLEDEMNSFKNMYRMFIISVLLICLVSFYACKPENFDDSGNIDWTLIGVDDFNRADTTYDGSADFTELGADWDAFADTAQDPNSMIEITGQRVELRGDSGADWQTKTNKSIVKLIIDLTTANIGTLNTSSGDLSNSFGLYDEQYNINQGGCPYTAGVALHSGVYTTYLIKQISGGSGFEEMAAGTVTFEPNKTYGFEFIINDGSLSFELTDASGDTINKITANGDSCTFVQPGFSIKYVDDTSFYFDNFKGYTGEASN